jgi:predicted TIM-barrel fold metal-dependent hydrolase
VHLLPPEYRSELERRTTVPMRLPPWSRAGLDDLMTRHEIDAAVMSLSPPGVWFGDQGLANELARMVNEATAELVASDPQRFAGLAFLPLPDVEAALAELAHSLDVLRLDGVALLSNVAGLYHGDPTWDSLWEELERRGAYVMLHPAPPPHPLPLPQHPIWMYEYPFDTTRAVVNLIYSGTLERSPSVRLQVAHLGGAATFLAHRIASLEAREPEKATLAPRGALSALARLYYDTGLSNNETALALCRPAPQRRPGAGAGRARSGSLTRRRRERRRPRAALRQSRLSQGRSMGASACIEVGVAPRLSSLQERPTQLLGHVPQPLGTADVHRLGR